MSNWITKEIERAVREDGVEVTPIGNDESEALRSRIIERYCPGKPYWPLWEHCEFAERVQDRGSWRWIPEFIGSHECIILFNPSDDTGAFSCRDGDRLRTLLGQTHGFEFYLTDRSASYLICFNHHDFLLAAGDAAPWLAKRRLAPVP